MRKLLFLLSLFTPFLAGSQVILQYQRDYQAPAAHNFTLLDMATDGSGNAYLLYFVDPGKHYLLRKLDAAGTTIWTDTVAIGNYSQVNVTEGRLRYQNNKLLVFGGFCQGSSCGAGLLLYDLNGNVTNSHLIPINWSLSGFAAYELSGGDLLVYYSYGDQFTPNPVMHVTRYTPAWQTVWTKSYPAKNIGRYNPSYLTPADEIIFSYTDDSVAGGMHYPVSYTRKLDNSGSLMWTHARAGVNYRAIGRLSNGDMVLGGNAFAPGTFYTNNGGDIMLTSVSDMNGGELWSQSYNGPGNERDEIYGIAIDNNDNIYIGGVQDVHDYTPFVNSSVLRKYNSSGTLQWSKFGTTGSSATAVYYDGNGRVICMGVHGNGFKVARYAASGAGIDSSFQSTSQAIGMVNHMYFWQDHVYTGFSEGHCGANHINLWRYCLGLDCTPLSAAGPLVDEVPGVYPNPASDQLFFAGANIARVEICNMTGAVVGLQLSGHTMDISSLPAGIYMVRMTTDAGTIQSKLLKL